MSQPQPTATFPVERTCPFDPATEYTRRRQEDPVSRIRLWNGQDAWLVTRYDDVRSVLRDPDLSADMSSPGFPLIRPAMQRERAVRTFIRMDPPEHTYFRRMLTREFMVKRVDAMRPMIERVVDERLDDLASRRPPADLVEVLALPVPSMVICDLLGVPYADHAFFQERSQVVLRRDCTPEQARATSDELRDYLGRLVAANEEHPGDNLIGRLVTDRERPGELTREDVVTMALLLLVAGHETTANMIGLSTLALLENPAELQRLRANPSLVPAAVEELLRYCTIVQFGLPRATLRDVRIGGQTIPAGDGVIALLSTANRDPGEFDDPTRLDLGRQGRRHIAFGYGVHQCLGQTLARAELQIVLTRLFDRFGTLRLAVPADAVPLRHDMIIFGTHELPVTW
ncbi:MAG TPA: cytochrome P450 [Mycobacteriales bacterium]|nr:cytochrome P450 [Mycobacteriales bacterium]